MPGYETWHTALVRDTICRQSSSVEGLIRIRMASVGTVLTTTGVSAHLFTTRGVEGVGVDPHPAQQVFDVQDFRYAEENPLFVALNS